MKSFVVIGLGRFGRSVARSLTELNYEVLAIDEDEELVQSIAGTVTHAVTGDCTDENVLKSLGIRNFDVAIVAIGQDMSTSIMVTLLLKELGVKYILAKAQNDLHSKVLERLGADRVVFPERDMGVRIAYSLTSTTILDYIELSLEHSIMEIVVPRNWGGKTIMELNIRQKYNVTIAAVKEKQGNKINVSPSADLVLKDDDILLVIGETTNLTKLK